MGHYADLYARYKTTSQGIETYYTYLIANDGELFEEELKEFKNFNVREFVNIAAKVKDFPSGSYTEVLRTVQKYQHFLAILRYYDDKYPGQENAFVNAFPGIQETNEALATALTNNEHVIFQAYQTITQKFKDHMKLLNQYRSAEQNVAADDTELSRQDMLMEMSEKYHGKVYDFETGQVQQVPQQEDRIVEEVVVPAHLKKSDSFVYFRGACTDNMAERLSYDDAMTAIGKGETVSVFDGLRCEGTVYNTQQQDPETGALKDVYSTRIHRDRPEPISWGTNREDMEKNLKILKALQQDLLASDPWWVLTNSSNFRKVKNGVADAIQGMQDYLKSPVAANRAKLSAAMTQLQTRLETYRTGKFAKADKNERDQMRLDVTADLKTFCDITAPRIGEFYVHTPESVTQKLEALAGAVERTNEAFRNNIRGMLTLYRELPDPKTDRTFETERNVLPQMINKRLSQWGGYDMNMALQLIGLDAGEIKEIGSMLKGIRKPPVQDVQEGFIVRQDDEEPEMNQLPENAPLDQRMLHRMDQNGPARHGL